MKTRGWLIPLRPPYSKEKIIRQQSCQLATFLQQVVWPFSGYYRDLFEAHRIRPESIRSLEDLQRLPFTYKEDLLNSPENPKKSRDFILIPDEALLRRRFSTIVQALLHGRDHVRATFEREFRPLFLTSTTGRSADPIPFAFTQHDLDRLALAGKRLMELGGAQKEDRMLNLFPYAPHLGFWQAHYAGMAFGSFVLSTGGGKVMGTRGNLRLLQKIQPSVLIGMPTFIYHVLNQAVEEGIPCPRLKKIVLGGEKVEPGMRNKLHKLAEALEAPDVDLLVTYGFTEAKMAFSECPCPAGKVSSGYHLYPDMALFEVVDPQTGEPVGEGEPGELVYTPLDARGTVVLRYRTGDFITGGLIYEPCPYCGSHAPRLVGQIRRSSEIREMCLDKIKGTLVDFNELEHVLDGFEHIGAWQIELRKLHDNPLEVDQLILHLQANEATNHETLEQEVSQRLFERTEIRPNRIEFHTLRELQKLQGVGVLLKEQKIVDYRKQPPPSEKEEEKWSRWIPSSFSQWFSKKSRKHPPQMTL